MNHLELVVHFVCFLCVMAEDTVPGSGNSRSETPLSESSGSGSGDGVFVDILVWDDLLATVAEKWAKQCHFDHDKNRDIPKYGLGIGQNVAGGYSSWVDAMQAWFDEVELYRYGEDTDDYLGIDGWMKVAHYTQMVQNTTSRLGCGYAECRNTEYYRFYVCNYASGQYSVKFPYTQGERCSKCPRSCSTGLCDCSGKLCLNGGRLDVSSCSCSCPALYKGDNCSEEITTSYVSKSNCTYIGERPSLADCKGYGDRGMDRQFCQSQGGELTCGDCERYTNVKTEYCPVMCAICPEVCGGKQCLNRGRLNPDTCHCKCNQPFSGDTCDILTCPERDKWHCAFFTPEHCSYSNIPIDCPYLCDICD